MIPWKDFVAHVQATSHKLDALAVFDLKGRPLIVTEGLELTETEGRTLLSCLGDTVLARARVDIDHVTYTTFQADADTLIGWGEDRKRLFVACRSRGDPAAAEGAGGGGGARGGGDEGALVLALARAEAHGSCLFELRRFLAWRKQRHTQPVPNLDPTPLLPSPLAPSPPSHGEPGVILPPSGGPGHQPLVSVDQVAVQMH